MNETLRSSRSARECVTPSRSRPESTLPVRRPTTSRSGTACNAHPGPEAEAAHSCRTCTAERASASRQKTPSRRRVRAKENRAIHAARRGSQIWRAGATSLRRATRASRRCWLDTSECRTTQSTARVSGKINRYPQPGKSRPHRQAARRHPNRALHKSRARTRSATTSVTRLMRCSMPPSSHHRAEQLCAVVLSLSRAPRRWTLPVRRPVRRPSARPSAVAVAEHPSQSLNRVVREFRESRAAPCGGRT